MLAAALALQAAAHLRRRPAAEIVLALDRATDVDLVGAALGHLAARARRLRQALVDGGPHRRPAQRAHRRPAPRPARPADGGWRRGGRRGVGRAGADLLGLARDRRLRRGGGRLVEALLDQRVGLALDLFLGLLARLFLGQALPVLLVGLLARLVLDGAAGGVLRPRAGARLSASRLASTRARVRASFSSSVRVFSTMPRPPGPVPSPARTRAAGRAGAAAPQRRRPASGCGRSAPQPALRARAQARRPPGAARRRARLTGFLTSTVTARVRPCENFWRTCVVVRPWPPRRCAPWSRGSAAWSAWSLLSVPSYRLLSLVRSGPSTGAVQSIAAPARRPDRNSLNELAARIVAGDRHINRLLAAEDAAQRRRIAQPGDRQAASPAACPARRRRPRRPRPAGRPGAGRSSARP